MRNIIKILFFIILIFFINLFFYYTSSDYRFFLKKIKDKDQVVYLEEKVVDDSFSLPENIQQDDVVVIENKPIEENKDIQIEREVVLWKNYQEIKSLFENYDLRYIEIHSNLFDITDEYPDDYYEYYSNALTLYFFPTKNYSQVLDIFNVLEYDLPFEVNQVNNFWENSFYINLKEDIDDSYVRLVISYKGVVFWLKIKKDTYNDIKAKLLSLSE